MSGERYSPDAVASLINSRILDNPDWYSISRVSLDEYEISILTGDVGVVTYDALTVLNDGAAPLTLPADHRLRTSEMFAVCSIVGVRVVGCAAMKNPCRFVLTLSDGRSVVFRFNDGEQLQIGLPDELPLLF